MLAVAVVALALGAWIWREQRLRYCLDWERRHLEAATRLRVSLPELESMARVVRQQVLQLRRHPEAGPMLRDWEKLLTLAEGRADHARAVSQHHSTLARRYRRAIRYPWLPLPDETE
jgi:hypothetical protein